MGGYTEKGADSLKLRVNAQSADSVQTGIGVRVTRPFKVKNAQVLPQASAFYQHEFANNSRGLDARLPLSAAGFEAKQSLAGKRVPKRGLGTRINPTRGIE